MKKTTGSQKEKIPNLEDYFKGCLFFTVGRLYRLIDRLAKEAFGHLGIAPSHAFLLMALFESKGSQATPSELSEVMNLDRSTVTRLIQELEKSGYVKRLRQGRTTNIRLLSKGKQLLPEIRKSWKSLYEKYCAVLGEDSAEKLNNCIVKHTN